MSGLKKQGLILFRGKSLCTKGWRTQKGKLRTYIIILPYRDILDAGKTLEARDEKLLVARDIKICVELCGWMWCMTEGGKAFPEMPAGKLCQTLFQMRLGQIFLWILLWDYLKCKVTMQYCCVCDQIPQTSFILFLLRRRPNSLGLVRLYRDHVWKITWINLIWWFPIVGRNCIGIHERTQ